MSEETVPAQSSVLDISDLRVAYGARTVVEGVSFQIHRGEIFGLLGPNGAGKTSTLSAIEGLVKPKSGRLLVDGIDAQQEPLDAKAPRGAITVLQFPGRANHSADRKTLRWALRSEALA